MKISIKFILALGAFVLCLNESQSAEQTYSHLFVIRQKYGGSEVGLQLIDGKFQQPSTIVGPVELSDGAVASHVTNLLGLSGTQNRVNKDAIMQICRIEQRPVTDNSWWTRCKSWFGYSPTERYLNDQGLKKRTDMYYVSVMDDQSARQIPESSQVKWISLEGIEKNEQVSAETRLYIEILRNFNISASTDVSLPVTRMQESFAERGVKAEITFTVPFPLFSFVIENNKAATAAYDSEKKELDFLEKLIIIPAVPFLLVTFLASVSRR